MIQMIINDAKAMEGDAITAEADSQTQYEVFVTDTNASIDAKRKEKIYCSEVKATAEQNKVEASMERDSVMQELEALASENADLHKSCDYTLKNFDLRQTAREAEIHALQNAISLLSGASFAAFLES